MNLQLKVDRPTLVVGGTLLVVLVLVVSAMLHLWLLRQGYVEEIEAIEPKMSRLLGIQESASQLSTAADTANSLVQELAYPADRDSASTAAALQQHIRELMTGAGLAVSGSQILPPRASPQFDRLRLDITAEGNIRELDEALASLEAMRPLVLVETLKVTPQRERMRARGRNAQAEAAPKEDPRNVTARLQLFALRLKN